MKESSTQVCRVSSRLAQALVTITLLTTIFISHVAWGQSTVDAADTIDVSILEREDLRLRTGKVFQRPDGSGYAVVYMRPIHFQASNGSWQNMITACTDETGLSGVIRPAILN